MTLDKKQHTASVGLAGCVGLLSLLLVSLVTPLTSGQAYADGEDGTEDSSDEVIPEGEPEMNYDNQIMTTAAAPTASTVTISFSPESASGAVTPVDSAKGDAAKVDVQATVRVQNSGGYSVYIGSSSSQLSDGKGHVIDSVTSATTYAKMDVNRWGYSFRKASSATDKAVDDSYIKMPATLRSTALDSNTATSIKDETRYYMLSFAARIGSDMPAGTYSNSVTMSVVSSPLEITNAFGIETMQEMSTSICSDAATGTTDRLRDTRDDKMYWVKKMPDGKCWMVQNLDLNLGSTWPDAAKSDYTTVSTTAPTPTQNQQTSTDTSQTNTRSWDFGEWVITNPSTSSSCGTGKNDLQTCTSQFTNVAGKNPSTNPTFYKDNQNKTVVGNEYDAHYLVGNYYSWNTATAGTGGTITSGEASGSICPKNWKLPTSNNTNAGSFGGLTATLTGANDTEKLTNLTGDGYFFVRGGGVWQNTDLFGSAGNGGHYWSSTAFSGGTNAYYLYFYSTSSINPASINNRRSGLSVRCIAR